MLHQAPWEEEVNITPYFTRSKYRKTWLAEGGYCHDERLSLKYDLVYFDAFAPEKQPEMWKEEIFRKSARRDE